jgi:carbon-monoxide dehydrogenase large subunit
VFVRSPIAHADFTIGDLEAVRAMPGVRGVYTAADFVDLGGLPCVEPVSNADGSPPALKPYPLMAQDKVYHVGDIVALVVADTYFQARDAAEALEIDWRGLPAVVDMEEAIKPGAPVVFDGARNNIVYDTFIGDPEKTNAAFAAAPRRVKLRIVIPRVVANYMEARSALGQYDSAADKFTLHVSSQGAHGQRDNIAAKILKIPAEKLRVVTGDVGGGFGTKIWVYREYPIVLEAARRIGKSVGWVADRTEHFLGDTQGRDNITTAELALDENGKFLAMRVDILGNIGAYVSMAAPYIPWLAASMATGTYEIGALHSRVRAVYTHTVPVDAYRGAGRPEAAYVLERLVDAAARELGISPDEIRARNFIKSNQMPYDTLTNRHYDVGDFEGAMRACLAKADYAGLGGRIAEARARGKLRGFGISSYIECTAWGGGEEGSVKLDPDGSFTLLIGTQSNGQGHETAYAQVVAEHLDVPIDRVRVIQGDTDRIPTGNGTGGSRSIPVGAVMVNRASQTLARTLKELAADKLETAFDDLEIADGAVRVAGTDRSIGYAEIAALPAATPEKTESDRGFHSPGCNLSEWHARLRSGNRSGDGRDPDCPLLDRRRFRLHAEPVAARRPSPRRHRPGRRPGVAGARRVRFQRPIADGKLHGLRRASCRQLAELRFRDPKYSVDHQSDGIERRGRSRLDRLDARSDERGAGRALSRLRHRAHRHASDTVRGLRCDPPRRRRRKMGR